MKRALKNTGLGFLGLTLLVLVTSFALPSSYVASASVVVEAPVDLVFSEVDTVRTWEDWTAWTAQRDPTLSFAYEGPPRGTGARVTWTSQELGSGQRVVTEAIPEKRIAFDVFFGEGGVAPAHSIISFENKDGGTKVTWTMTGRMGLLSPGRSQVSSIEADFQKSLRGLKDRCEMLAMGLPVVE